MKKIYIAAALVFFTVVSGYSQKFGIGFQTGIGSYSMSELESLNSYVIKNVPIKTKLVSDFPAYLYFRPSISLNFDNFGIGLLSTLQSTGSRVSAKDYSGEYRFDMKVKSHNPGVYGEVAMFTEEKIRLAFSSILGITMSKLKIEESTVIFNGKLITNKSEFKALNYYVEPGFNFYFRLYFMTVGINTGCFLQLGKQAYYTDNNKDYKLVKPETRNTIKPDWNGFRLGLSIRYDL